MASIPEFRVKIGVMDELRFETALVTGASAGLGREFARQLAPRCRRLVLVARRTGRLDDLAGELRTAVPQIEVFTVGADLAETDQRLGLIEGLLVRGLVPDLLVNNAGLGDYGEFATADWGRVEAMLRVNIEALTHLTHALLPGMLGGGRGAIINVSSIASLLPIPDFAVYAATKAYVTSFSEALRAELRSSRIPVLAVCPGPVPTEFSAVAIRSASAADAPPAHAAFYVDPRQVVAESLVALARNRARVFPGLKIALAAALIGVLPVCVLRAALSVRPRRRA